MKTRRNQYMQKTGYHPDEIVGATNLECENELRRMDGYCTQLGVDRCLNCSLCSYDRDCHNAIVARMTDTPDCWIKRED